MSKGDPWPDAWKLTFAEKKKMLAENRVAVGGTDAGLWKCMDVPNEPALIILINKRWSCENVYQMMGSFIILNMTLAARNSGNEWLHLTTTRRITLCQGGLYLLGPLASLATHSVLGLECPFYLLATNSLAACERAVRWPSLEPDLVCCFTSIYMHIIKLADDLHTERLLSGNWNLQTTT